MGLKYNNNNNS